MHWNEKGYANECVCVSLFWLFHSRLSGCHCVCLLCDPLRLHPKMMTTFLPDDSHLFFFLCYYIRRPPSSLWMGWQRIRITFQTPIFCCAAAAAAAALGGMRIATDSLWSTFSGYHREDEKRRERKTRFFCVYYVFFFFLTDMRARHPAAPSQLAAGCDWISLSLPDADEWSIYLPPPARWIMNRKKGVVAQLPCNPSSIQSRPEAGRRMRTIVTMAIDYHYSFWRRRKKINRRRRFPSFRVDEPVKSVGDSALFLLNFLLFNLYSRGLVAAQDRGNRCSRFRDTCTSPRSVYCSVRDEHLPVASSAKKEKGRRRRRHGWVGTTSSWPVRYLSWLYDDNLQKNKIKYENASALRSSLHLNPI